MNHRNLSKTKKSNIEIQLFKKALLFSFLGITSFYLIFVIHMNKVFSVQSNKFEFSVPLRGGGYISAWSIIISLSLVASSFFFIIKHKKTAEALKSIAKPTREI